MTSLLALVFTVGVAFLEEAKITETSDLMGKAEVVRLSLGDVEVRGLFKTRHTAYDNYHNEIMAYKLGTLLGLNIPPVVYRGDHKEGGSLQLLVEGCRPVGDGEYDLHTMRAFDRLIQNPDRHKNNYLSCGGELLLIDHSRSFILDPFNFERQPVVEETQHRHSEPER